MKLNKKFIGQINNKECQSLKIANKTVAEWKETIETCIYSKFDREVNIEIGLYRYLNKDTSLKRCELSIELKEPSLFRTEIRLLIDNTRVRVDSTTFNDEDIHALSEFLQFADYFRQYLGNFMVL